MDRHTFFGKSRIGFTRIYDFTDFQGLGSDPLYRRYPSVASIVKRIIPAQYVDFLAVPDQPAGEDTINWYIPQWTETPRRLTELTGNEATRYARIKDMTLGAYMSALQKLSGEELMVMGSVLRYIDDEFIYCADGKVYLLAWGMTPDKSKHIAVGEIVHAAPNMIRYTVTFDPGKEGSLRSDFGRQIQLTTGTVIDSSLIPDVVPEPGYEFDGWTPNPEGHIVESDITFVARYRDELPPPFPQEETPPMPVIKPFTITFDAGPDGILNGPAVIEKMPGQPITQFDIPPVAANKGFRFVGWDFDPLTHAVNGDYCFHACYQPVKKSIWSRWWFWLLLLLGILLLGWLLSELLPGCSGFGCSRSRDSIDSLINFNDDAPELNLPFKPIEPVDGRLPGDEDGPGVVAPVRDPDGNIPEPIRNPGVPPTLPGRLFLFLEDSNGNIDELATDFKSAYPGDQYSIIGFDREVKSLVIQVPESERDWIRESLQQRLPKQKFIVMDERIYELNRSVDYSKMSASAGWHLEAVNARQAWDITSGSSDVIVAVVDDGFDGSHPMFRDRIVAPYNVFTQNNHLGRGSGHGTHTAGLAVGSQISIRDGASGMAPNCRLMPVQVFDNGMCPASALISGIMYAVHKGADVVNMSVGPSFPGLSILPVQTQDEIARTRFKNEEILWNRVAELAKSKGTILVFAAGNENIISAIAPENRTDFAITVGAIDRNFNPTDFTNYGNGTDVSAPGSEILSSWAGGGLKAEDGTSMSAPIVAGTIALMKSLKKDLTVEQARNVLQRTGVAVNGPMPPRILADKALIAVRNGDFSAPAGSAGGSTPPAYDGGLDHGNGNGSGNGGGFDLDPTPGQNLKPSPGSLPGTDFGKFPSNGGDSPSTPPAVGTDGSDEEAILKQIEYYRRKIRELEDQLDSKHRVRA